MLTQARPAGSHSHSRSSTSTGPTPLTTAARRTTNARLASIPPLRLRHLRSLRHPHCLHHPHCPHHPSSLLAHRHRHQTYPLARRRYRSPRRLVQRRSAAATGSAATPAVPEPRGRGT
jgi:hypothetical protein